MCIIDEPKDPVTTVKLFIGTTVMMDPLADGTGKEV